MPPAAILRGTARRIGIPLQKKVAILGIDFFKIALWMQNTSWISTSGSGALFGGNLPLNWRSAQFEGFLQRAE